MISYIEGTFCFPIWASSIVVQTEPFIRLKTDLHVYDRILGESVEYCPVRKYFHFVTIYPCLSEAAGN